MQQKFGSGIANCYTDAMKWIFLATFFLTPFSLYAQSEASSAIKPLHQQPSNVEIINGKRFFSLQNARHFNGSANNPKALSVLHHPREAGTVTARKTFPLPGPKLGPSPALPASAAQPAKLPAGASDQVLSIFTPDEKTPALSPAR